MPLKLPTPAEVKVDEGPVVLLPSPRKGGKGGKGTMHTRFIDTPDKPSALTEEAKARGVAHMSIENQDIWMGGICSDD